MSSSWRAGSAWEDKAARERIAKGHPEPPLLLTGDFNAVNRTNLTHDVLVENGGLANTWKLAGARRNADLNTFNGFGPIRRNGERSDWILGRGSSR